MSHLVARGRSRGRDPRILADIAELLDIGRQALSSRGGGVRGRERGLGHLEAHARDARDNTHDCRHPRVAGLRAASPLIQGRGRGLGHLGPRARSARHDARTPANSVESPDDAAGRPAISSPDPRGRTSGLLAGRGRDASSNAHLPTLPASGQRVSSSRGLRGAAVVGPRAGREREYECAGRCASAGRPRPAAAL